MKCLTCFSLVGLSFISAVARISAAPYSFTNIIDTSVAAPSGNYLSFADAAIGGNTVAFKAVHTQDSRGSLTTS